MTNEVRAVLDCPMIQPNDANATTVRDYLVTLLQEVWQEREGFDGKRPFGNSSWASEIYSSLGRTGRIYATFDEDGYLEHADTKDADRLVSAAIDSLGEDPS